jgi:GNAT superfamily N-acetyltransferase
VQVTRGDGYEIDTAPGRIDLPRVQHWLTTDAYWAQGRTPEAIERSVTGSVCFGVYAPDGAQVGFARAVTDGATFAWIADVYVARERRGLGLGTWLAGVVRDHIMGLGVPRIVLATMDAHGVYEKAGFAPLVNPDRYMEIDRRPSFRPTGERHT